MANKANRTTGDVSAPTSNTAAVLTYAALAGQRHYIDSIEWSYSGTPTAGNLKIQDGDSNVIFTLDVTAGGPGFFTFRPALTGDENTALTVTLAAGGSGVSGKVNASHRLA